MISILIPVYNSKITDLVTELNKQALALKIAFEIVCLDDASSNVKIVVENQKISDFENCKYILASENKGRTATRNALANMAKFDYLLFLDADVFPAHEDFLANYLTEKCLDTDVVMGGLDYRKQDYKPEVSLRWFYGIHREIKSIDKRKEAPYQHVLSCNFLVKKDYFLKLALPTSHLYGMDNYFSYLLMQQKATVLHIENVVFHLGLETNAVFLSKSLESVQNRKDWMQSNPDFEMISPLISSYKKIEKWHLAGLLRFIFKSTEPVLKRLIFKKKPNLTAFDFYRLGYLCENSKQ